MGRKDVTFLLFIFGIALFLRLTFIDTTYVIWDEAVYLLHGKLFGGEEIGYEEISLRPPLISLFLAIIWKLSPQNYLVYSKVFLAFFNSLIVFPVYYLGKLFDERVARFSSSLIAIFPLSILHSRYVLTDHPACVLGLMSFILMYYGTKNQNPVHIYASALFLSLAVLMKFTNLLIWVLILPLVLELIRRKKIKEIFFFIFIFFMGMLPYILFNYLKFGNPFYTFIKASHVISEGDKSELSFLVYLFNDSLGTGFVLFSFLGILIFMKEKIFNRQLSPYERKYNLILIYASLTLFVYSSSIVFRNVAKPPTIPWEVERFFLLLVSFLVCFISYFFVEFGKYFKLDRPIFFIIFSFFILFSFSFLITQYQRCYTPQIEFEQGLRYVTKEMGLYLNTTNIPEVVCIGNCPPIAFYSNKKIHVVYSEKEFLESPIEYKIAFFRCNDSSLKIIKEICKGESCAYLYKKLNIPNSPFG